LQVRAYQAAVRATQAMGVTVVRYTAILNAEVRPSLKPTYISGSFFWYRPGLCQPVSDRLFLACVGLNRPISLRLRQYRQHNCFPSALTGTHTPSCSLLSLLLSLTNSRLRWWGPRGRRCLALEPTRPLHSLVLSLSHVGGGAGVARVRSGRAGRAGGPVAAGRVRAASALARLHLRPLRHAGAPPHASYIMHQASYSMHRSIMRRTFLMRHVCHAAHLRAAARHPARARPLQARDRGGSRRRRRRSVESWRGGHDGG
jgi:hypothetical protein